MRMFSNESILVNMNDMYKRICLLIGIYFIFNIPLSAKSFIISDKNRIEDAPLLDGEFSELNFGGAYLLEVGKMVGIYVEHTAKSLLRFDMQDVKFNQIRSAKVRLYKPNCFIQLFPVEVGLYKVEGKENWEEGMGICELSAKGCSWGKWKDKTYTLIKKQTVSKDEGGWVEFEIPSDLVQDWLEHPESNKGMCIEAIPQKNQWGEHLYFYASEHYSGKGPQLVVEGTGERKLVKTKTNPQNKKKEHGYLAIKENAFNKWLRASKRLANFTFLAEMDRDQAKLFYYYDVIFRRDFLLNRYQIPLGQTFSNIDEAVAKNDEARTRTLMKDVRKYLLVWEYLRETDWYTSGPLAEILSPWQLSALFGKGVFGRMEESALEENKKIWVSYDKKGMLENMDKTMRQTKEKLRLPPQVVDIFRQYLEPIENMEHKNLMDFKNDLVEVQRAYAGRLNDITTFNNVKQMHLHHEVFLYYQSIYNTPRWFYFMDNAPIIPYAKWIVNTRRRMYNVEANQKQLNEIRKYLPIK